MAMTTPTESWEEEFDEVIARMSIDGIHDTEYNRYYGELTAIEELKKVIRTKLEEVYRRGREDAVEYVKGKRLQFAYPNFSLHEAWDGNSEDREWCFFPAKLYKLLEEARHTQ